MKTVAFFVFAFFVCVNGVAQHFSVVDSVRWQLNRFGEVELKVKLADVVSMDALTDVVSVDNVKDGFVYFYANAKQFEQFLASDLSFYLVSSATRDVFNTSKNMNGIRDWDTYPTYSQYIELMKDFVKAYPSLCRLDTIGTTVDGKLLLAVKISDNVSVKEAEPEFFYSSTMHGNELVGYVMMLRLIDYLLTNYGVVDQVTHLVDNIEIYINPNANPDGTYQTTDDDVMYSTRGNANYVDLNRNFPDAIKGSHPDGNEYQPETLAMMAYMKKRNFVVSANFHSGAEVVNYPWDNSNVLHADDAWFADISRQYADTVLEISASTYFTGVSTNGYVRGYKWYVAYGTRQDYSVNYCNTREVTIEVDVTKLTPTARLGRIWNYNYRSLLNYMETCLLGINGRVSDAQTGKSVYAKITVNNHDIGNSFVYTDSLMGMYYRPIESGVYDLKVSSEQYHDTIITGVSVVAGQAVGLDIKLRPLYPLVGIDEVVFPEADDDSFLFRVSNPFNDDITVAWFQNDRADLSFALTDVAGRLVFSERFSDVDTGSQIRKFSTSNLKAGIYFLKISDGRRCAVEKIIRE